MMNAVKKNPARIPWAENDTVMLPAGLPALPWLCGSPEWPLLVVLPTQKDIESFATALRQLWGTEALALPPIPLDAESVGDLSYYVKRGQTLLRWDSEHPVVVTSPGGLMGPLRLSRQSTGLTKGSEINRDEFIRWLFSHGYNRSDIVWSPGQFSSRGFIIDIYDPAHLYPIRIELFDEEIESIRSFRPGSQKSVAELLDVNIHVISNTESVDFADFLKEDTRVIFFEAEKLQNHGDSYKWLWDTLGKGSRIESIPDWTEIYLSLASCMKVRINPGFSSRNASLDIENPPLFKGSMSSFIHFCRVWHEEKYKVRIYSSNRAFLGYGKKAGCEVFEGNLSGGLVDNETKTVILSDLELSGVAGRDIKDQEIQAPAEWSDLFAPGDHVIHDLHGVALFKGLEQVIFNDSVTEMIVLEFAGSKRLMIPVMQIHQINTLSSFPGEDISLDVLGGKRWKKSVEKEKERARKEAEQIARVYARREVLEGFSFSGDNELTEEFERSFPFAETADQLRAIEAVKRDMEASYPMDRLIVGDVGYGKTEVAVRAAIKAVQDGKQVAFLVPTTILAQQHYQTFQIRFAGFPVNIRGLSRFLTRKEQKDILNDLAEGKIDIIIGTQRLLQEDVNFKDLGLMIIDEEHRFGVSSKEKLKSYNNLVDVLTLSATPIPRTLSLSLKSLKDFSTIRTPPENRIPVVTFVGPWDKKLVEQSVTRELNRGGQVFYVHNRVRSIHKIAAQVREMFPEAAVGVAHGQMKEKELEKTMVDFYEARTDILVCTTIIESGLDVGKANTLIIDDAHEMGMAQLYQLRGRIGRRSETAYAFFLYPWDQELGQTTTERLEAIASVSDPGGGYDLALNDLALRGSGDILGIRQHGRITSMSSGHYYRFLDEELKKLRGEYFEEPDIDVRIDITIPGTYIPQDSVRITLYRRIMRAESIDEIDSIAREARDRFGPAPRSVKNLLEVSRFRIAARQSVITSAEIDRTRISVYGDPDKLGRIFSANSGWLLKGNRAVGPGSLEGLVSLKNVILSSRKSRSDVTA